MTAGILRSTSASPGGWPVGIGLGGLLGVNMPAPLDRYPDVVLDDGIDTRYRFAAHHISGRQYGVNVVYGFATVDARGIYIHYIGRAETLSERLSGHEKMSTAIARGANRLLIHEPTALDVIDYKTAERRLIARYCPLLNTHHNQMVGLGGLAGLNWALGLGR